MFTKHSFKILLPGVVLFALLALAGHNQGLLAGVATPPSSGPFTSPLPTPPPTPTPSPQAQIALQHIAKREGIPLDGLLGALLVGCRNRG